MFANYLYYIATHDTMKCVPKTQKKLLKKGNIKVNVRNSLTSRHNIIPDRLKCRQNNSLHNV